MREMKNFQIPIGYGSDIGVGRSQKLAHVVFLLMILFAVYRVIFTFFGGLPPTGALVVLGAAGLISMPMALNSIVKKARSESFSKGLLFILLLVGCLVFSQILQAVFFNELFDDRGISSHGYTRNIVFWGLIWISIGAVVQRIKFNRTRIYSLAFLSFLGAAVFAALDGSLVVSYSEISNTRGGADLDHLVVGESAALLLILSFAFSGRREKIWVVLVSLLILFSLGGRTALFTYALSLLAYLFFRKAWGFLLVIIVALTVAFSAFALDLIPLDSYDGAVSRMLLTDGFDGDESAVERGRLLAEGISALPSQILIGDPTYLVSHFGSMGLYIHNILSAWQFFGFFVFAIFCYISVYILSFLWRSREVISDPISSFGVIYFLYALISSLTGKYIGFAPLWFVVGFWLFRIAEYSSISGSRGRSESEAMAKGGGA